MRMFLAFCFVMLVAGFLIWFNTDTASSWEAKAYTAFAAVVVMSGLNVLITHWWQDTHRWYREGVADLNDAARTIRQLSADLDEARCPRCVEEIDGDYCEKHAAEVQHL